MSTTGAYVPPTNTYYYGPIEALLEEADSVTNRSVGHLKTRSLQVLKPDDVRQIYRQLEFDKVAIQSCRQRKKAFIVLVCIAALIYGIVAMAKNDPTVEGSQRNYFISGIVTMPFGLFGGMTYCLVSDSASSLDMRIDSVGKVAVFAEAHPGSEYTLKEWFARTPA